MSERYDYIAIGPHGVYALCEDLPNDRSSASFIRRTLRRGHRIERVLVAEAVERHLAFLAGRSPTAPIPHPAPDPIKGDA